MFVNDVFCFGNLSDFQIFSVRIDDRGLDDERGFVQLPLNNSSKGLCFIDKCPKTFNSEILKVHEKGQQTDENNTLCQHIAAAKNCVASATSIALNPMIIDSMDLLPNVKEVRNVSMFVVNGKNYRHFIASSFKIPRSFYKVRKSFYKTKINKLLIVFFYFSKIIKKNCRSLKLYLFYLIFTH